MPYTFICKSCERESKKQGGWCEPVPYCYDCLRIGMSEWATRNLRLLNSKYDGYSYLVTFTKNPNSRYDSEKWLHRVIKELKRKPFKNVQCTIEHITTNIHCHAVIDVNKAIAKSLFSVFIRDYGFVDVRRVNHDNGVAEYISKDLPPDEKPLTPEGLRKYLPELTN